MRLKPKLIDQKHNACGLFTSVTAVMYNGGCSRGSPKEMGEQGWNKVGDAYELLSASVDSTTGGVDLD